MSQPEQLPSDPPLTLGALGERMGLRVLEASPDRAVGSLPVAGNTQPYGILHGGASCVLAEQLGSIAAALHAGPGRVALGVELNASHHRAVATGHITGVATAITRGGTLASYEILISDDEGRRVCTARLTCVIRDER
ncbi:MAG: 1,4-dihydroxy-2-naphthoyl-CoA hydrolase [Frankiales bacterium]|jgi:1,4-dihydroxy-2-naphthoyl-CoA hydrolase|nr:1,4-dihydroxy-2-naphthoyl-CoA hydrolase [Frankiales bacterium]MDX6210330.1 1,4-dihydroxy-2-naphthoyl-CoA hydrolase [Frankiales bacterium]MDX6211772.1 1,4-dihydroxy-2-naphthoyl-CoA hydrolase [Frankiales bacterium]MDX6221896.1 1,4-dihydroxy-2-naphthoyl-CoA hydrolase [Frankiales bacterium]